MHNQDAIEYAISMTRVVLQPDRRIDTFGSTNFHFKLVTDVMDRTSEARVREGRIEAEKPVILKPENMNGFQFEGFGEQAQAFGQWLKTNASNVAFLKYGFQFRRNEIRENILHDNADTVARRIADDTAQKGDPMTAVIQGVDEAWEICLLKFTVEMIGLSQGINIFDFRRKGFL